MSVEPDESQEVEGEKSRIKITMTATLAKGIVKAIENTDEQAIFVFDKYGLFVRVADPLHSRVVELMVEPSCFESYDFYMTPQDESENHTQIRMGVVISRLKDITKTLVKKDMLELEYVDGTNRIETFSKSIQRSIRLIRSELMNQIPEIKVSHLFSAEMENDTLKPFLKAANTKGGSVDVITDGKFILSSETDEGAVQIILESEAVNLRPIDYVSMTSYSVQEIAKATSTGTGLLSIKGKQNAPLELKWKTATGMQIKAWIAPRL